MTDVLRRGGGHPDTGVTPKGDNGAGAKSSGAADIQGMPCAPELGRALGGFPSRFWKEYSIPDTLI